MGKEAKSEDDAAVCLLRADDAERWRTSAFEDELIALLNRFSAEDGSQSPDFILATYLIGCLDAFNAAVRHREAWHGRQNIGVERTRRSAPPERKEQ